MKRRNLNLGRKLMLGKETIGGLTDPQSEKVIGGKPTGGGNSCVQSCYQTWCNQQTCVLAVCNTNLCPNLTLQIDCQTGTLCR